MLPATGHTQAVSFAGPMISDQEPLLRAHVDDADESDTFANRPDHGTGTQAPLIEEEPERTLSDASGAFDNASGGGDAADAGAEEGFALRRGNLIGEPGAEQAPAAPQRPGFFSRMGSGISRGLGRAWGGMKSAFKDFGFGRLFGSAREHDENDGVAAARETVRRKVQRRAGRRPDDSIGRTIVGPKMPWMERLFGAAKGGQTTQRRQIADADAYIDRQVLRQALQAQRREPGKRAESDGADSRQFMFRTPNRVRYGEGRNAETKPTNFYPNSSWAVQPHALHTGETLGAKRGTNNSGGTPDEAQRLLEDSRRKAEDAGTLGLPGERTGAGNINEQERLRGLRRKQRALNEQGLSQPSIASAQRNLEMGVQFNLASNIGNRAVIAEVDEDLEDDQ